ncbi:MAG: MFS transporter [Myxococcota bacterium]
MPALAALSHREFRLLFIALPFVTTGSGMRGAVNAFQVYQLTGDARLLGLTFLIQGLPSLVMGLFGGTLADVMDRCRLLRFAVGAQIAIALALAWLTGTGRIEVWHIYVATFVGAAFQSLANPAQQALVPATVSEGELMNAMALLSAGGQAAMLLGPLLGGALLDLSGATIAYVIDAALILPAMLALAMLRIRDEPARRQVRLNLESIFEGLAFVLRTRVLLAFLLLDTVTMVIGYYPAMMPVIAKDVLAVGATGLGALLAAPAVGALLGFVGVLALGNIRRKGAVIVAVSVAHGIVLAAFAWASWFPAALLLAATLGFLDSLSVSVRVTCFQQLAPEELRGRVMSVLFIAAVSANSLGGATLGLATSWVGPQWALAAGGLIAAAFSVAIGVGWKSVRTFRL